MTTGEILDSVRELGGELTLQGNKLPYRLPDCPEARELLEAIKRDKEAIKALLRDSESQPPTLEEIKAALPPGVRLVSYQPKQAPFAVAPVSVVTNAGQFFRAYLRDLNWRMAEPQGYHVPPLTDILAKLADAGLELQLEKPGAFVNAHGLEVSDDDVPF